MLIQQTTLPKKQDTKAFMKLTREDPAVHNGATRVDRVTHLLPLEQESEIEREKACPLFSASSLSDFQWAILSSNRGVRR